ncbi:MAG TPA: hypothetical protein VN929_08410 [Burkholderiales bacterium]|nr:hypothetical protein [Burkholderiales bacterium]
MTSAMISGAAAFAIYLVATLIFLRLMRDKSAAVVVTIAIVAYFGGLFIPVLKGVTLNFWEYTAVFSCFTLTFLMAFGAIYKSVSLRMLDFLLDHPNHAASKHSLMTRYVAEESFEHRLDVILQSRFAARFPDGFVLTRKGRAVARAVTCLHALFAIERIG